MFLHLNFWINLTIAIVLRKGRKRTIVRVEKGKKIIFPFSLQSKFDCIKKIIFLRNTNNYLARNKERFVIVVPNTLDLLLDIDSPLIHPKCVFYFSSPLLFDFFSQTHFTLLTLIFLSYFHYYFFFVVFFTIWHQKENFLLINNFSSFSTQIENLLLKFSIISNIVM